jgi:hypothetical protein
MEGNWFRGDIFHLFINKPDYSSPLGFQRLRSNKRKQEFNQVKHASQDQSQGRCQDTTELQPGQGAAEHTHPQRLAHDHHAVDRWVAGKTLVEVISDRECRPGQGDHDEEKEQPAGTEVGRVPLMTIHSPPHPIRVKTNERGKKVLKNEGRGRFMICSYA